MDGTSYPDIAGADAARIARLAAMPQLEYERIRLTEAEAMGVRASALDAQVSAARRAADMERTATPAFSDEDLASRFSAQHAADLRYVASWGKWLIREPARWRIDDTLHIFDQARAVCREAASECNDNDMGRRIAAAATVSAVERLARSDRRHAATSDQFDVDPWALNTPNGVVDLTTGEMRAHRPDDHFTKVAAVSPGGDCPRWLQFLDEITQGDGQLVSYLQRFIGYTLTGIIREHAFAFLQGPGGNGKSVLLGTSAGILGDYATTAMADVFTVGRNDQHPTHVASLRGARMVVVTETEEGRPWAESRIKALTGGDKITARVMRGDPFEFSPVFKLWIAGNHRPTLRNPDPAMRRRLHLVPLTYVPAQPDPELANALKAEWPGILAWAIEGCLAWQREGLRQPPVVADASAEYFAEQDSLAAWIDERCERVAGARLPARAAFADWKAWSHSRGEEPGTEKRFSAELERHFAKQRMKTGVQFLGAKLLPNETGVL